MALGSESEEFGKLRAQLVQVTHDLKTTTAVLGETEETLRNVNVELEAMKSDRDTAMEERDAVIGAEHPDKNLLQKVRIQLHQADLSAKCARACEESAKEETKLSEQGRVQAEAELDAATATIRALKADAKKVASELQKVTMQLNDVSDTTDPRSGDFVRIERLKHARDEAQKSLKKALAGKRSAKEDSKRHEQQKEEAQRNLAEANATIEALKAEAAGHQGGE